MTRPTNTPTRPGRLRTRLKPLVFLTHLALTATLAAAVTPLAHAQASRHYDIPAGPLDAALNRFAVQSGVALAIDAEKLKGLNSEGLKGNYAIDTGFTALLRNTGYGVARTPSGYILVALPKNVDAGGGGGEAQLAPVLVVEQHEPMGTMVVNRQKIENLPAGNGDITSLLKIHPNVQFDNKQLSSKTPGEISPAEISINGAKFYQNAFLVDGVNFNNDIDPAQEATPFRLDSAPGNSQGMALDTDLLEEIKVLDSNVSAAYGRFNGGVVEATTRKPSKELRGKISAQMTRSSWTRYHIDKSQQESFENSSSFDEQPDFKKLTLRGTLEGHLTDNFGLLFNFTQKRSDITSMLYQAHHIATMGNETADQKRRIDNYFLKSVWKVNDRLDLDTSLTYAPEKNHYFRSGQPGGGVDIERGGLQFNLKARWRADWGNVEHSLGWSDIQQSRDAESNDWMTWRKSTSKPWGAATNSIEGENGDIEQKQTGWQYKLDANWDSFEWLGANHKIRAGLELADQYVFYERLTESSVYVLPKTTNTCTNSSGVTDTQTCAMGLTTNGWPGQFLSSRTRYTTGKFDFTTTSYALYLEDSMDIGRFNIRPGIRVDSDNYMDKTTVAPRMALGYDLFGNGETYISGGVNRYYGRNIATWRLQEGRARLRLTTETRPTLNDNWSVGTPVQNAVKFSELDIPYDNEVMLGASQRWNGLKFDLKYVNRKGYDQVIKAKGTTLGAPSTDPNLSSSYTTWTNGGQSETDIYSLTISSLRNFTLMGTSTSGQLALDWTKSKKSSPTYFDDGDIYFDDPYIQYQGQIMRYSERPADNFSRPWTLRLSTMTSIPKWNMTWTNFLRYRAAYTKVAQTVPAASSTVIHNGQPVAIWEKRKFNNALTWDLRLGWEYPMARNQAFFVNLDVFNVLDKASVADSTSVTATGVPTYEIGRQFWLEVGYRF